MQFLKFIGVGMIATLIHIAVFWLVVAAFNASAVQASIPAFVAAVGLSFAMNRAWTFAAAGQRTGQLPRFVLIALIGLGLNVLITYIAVNVIGLSYAVGLAAVVLFVPGLTFAMNRTWTFRPAAA